MREIDLVIIGGGPAGLAAAIAAYEKGIRDMLILDRDSGLGGILQQCIHNGFGLHRFSEELTGPEYAHRFAQKVAELKIPVMLETMVLSLTEDRLVTAVNAQEGVFTLRAKAVILAMGCRERTRGALNIAGSRPAGVYTAGTAQKYVNRKGFLPGKKIVILGSGDIGLIMARRMTLEGAKVQAVAELMPYSGGLTRNIVQCLEDFQIPLLLSHTVTEIRGKERVESVVIAAVDENKKPIIGTEKEYECDALFLSVGLLPENELTRQAGIALDPVTGGAVVCEDRQTVASGVFACGNVLHVHDLVDFVSEEAEIAGRGAAQFISEGKREVETLRLTTSGGVRYAVPQRIHTDANEPIKVFFRVGEVLDNPQFSLLDESGEVLLTKRKKRATPGEMETLTITPTMLAKAKGNLILRTEQGNGK